MEAITEAPKCNYLLLPDINLICYKAPLPQLKPTEALSRKQPSKNNYLGLALFMLTSSPNS